MSINSRRVHGRDPSRPLFFTYCSLRNDNVTSATSLIYYAYACSRAGTSAAFHGVDFPDYCFCNLEANLCIYFIPTVIILKSAVHILLILYSYYWIVNTNIDD